MKKTLLCCMLCLAFLLPLAAPGKGLAQEDNLLKNPGFETVDSAGMPEGWYTDAYILQEGYTDYGAGDAAHAGEHAAFVENYGANDARFAQDVAVEPNTTYCLNGYVRTEDVGDAGRGANLSVEGVYVFSDSVYGTGDWQQITLYGRTGPDQRTVTVFARLGGYGGESQGKAWFDDLSLTKMADGVPSGQLETLWYQTESAASDQTDTSGETGTSSSNWPSLLALGIAYLILMLLILPSLKQASPSARLRQEEQDRPKVVLTLAASLSAAFLLRIILAMLIPGMEHDVNDFRAWGSMMWTYGPADIYQKAGLLDYPPALLYLWWLNSGIESILNLTSRAAILLNVKFVPILADMAGAVLLWRVAKKRLPLKSAAALSIAYAFNPAVLLNGAAWGQMDSILALGLALVVIYALERRWEIVLPAYVLCVLMKPQALMLGPLGLAAIIVDVARQKDKRPWKELGWGFFWSAILGSAILIPFYINQPVGWLVKLYASTLSSYPYTTLNTTNFYYFPASYNWQPLTDEVGRALPLILALVMGGLAAWRFLAAKKAEGDFLKRYGLPAFLALACATFLALAVFPADFNVFGWAMMGLVIVWVLLAYVRGGSLQNLPLMGAILFIGLYVLGVKMHERYLFPALILLCLAYALKRDWRILVLLAGFSVTTFIDAGIVLDNSIRLGTQYLHLNGETYGLAVILSLLNLALTGFAFYTGERLCAANVPEQVALKPAPAVQPRSKAPASKPAFNKAREALISPADARLNLKRLDVLLLVGITLAYSVLTFWNLGSTKAPQTAWVSNNAGEQVVLNLGSVKDFRVLYYGGINYNDFTVAVSDNGTDWSEEYSARMQEGNCFQWQYLVNTLSGDTEGSVTYTDVPRELTARFVRVTAEDIGLNLSEVILRTQDQQVLPVTLSAHTGANPDSKYGQPAENLIDEQDTLIGEPSWYNGTYFDEIYHARTAYEHAHGLPTYETTHPPLGKVIMSWCVMIFGMTPFGWRFAGALVGVLMLPVMYLLGKQLTRRTDLAAAAMLLMTFDLMHFTQTRIATIDSFPVLFIMASYLFMFRYLMMDYWGTPFWKTLVPLAFSGLFMGLAIASKWIGIYAGFGLAALFFWSCIRHIRESLAAAQWKDRAKTVPKERREAVETAAKDGISRVVITLAWCLLFFIAVPAAIYYLSYIPYFAYSGGVTLEKVIQAQKSMYSYQSTPGLGADHPFKSPWWQWPLILKPMGYNTRGVIAPEGMAYTIYAMGNPAVWWAGFVALLLTMAAWVKRHIWADERGNLLHAGTRTADMVPSLVLIGFMSQYLPWVLVPRSTFIYHYFASVPFIILCTVICFNWLRAAWREGYKPLLWALVALASLMFVGFYPYASGVTVSTKWLDFMKWFPRIYY